MPRTGVSYDEVAESIQSLEKAGLKPSIRLIREKLGRGSLSTIAEQKRAYDQDASQGPGDALPDPVTRGLIKGAEAFWQELVEAAEHEISVAKAAAEAEIGAASAAQRALENDLATIREENGTLVVAVKARDERIADLETQAKEIDGQRQTAEKELARLSEKLAAAVDLDQEKTQQINGYRDDIKLIRKERESLENHLERQATDHARELGSAKERLAAETAARQAEDDALKSALAKADECASATAAAERRVGQLEVHVGSLENELETVRSELQSARKEAQAHADRAAEATTELKVLKQVKHTMLAEKDARIADLRLANEALDQALKQKKMPKTRKSAA